MTLVVTWLNLERPTQPTIWTAADTKITQSGVELTSAGSKVFELPVVCASYTTNGFEVYHKSALGMAYAGSSLIGLNTIATLSVIMTNLGGIHNRSLPDYNSILSKAKDVLQIYCNQMFNIAEVSIWGFCPKTKEPFIGAIRPTINESQMWDYVIEVDNCKSTSLRSVVLGSNSAETAQMIETERWMYQHYEKDNEYWRLPIKVLRNVINDNDKSEVGGNIQLAVIDRYRFIHMAITKSKDLLEANTRKYRNLDVFEEIGTTVGDCSISIDTMDIDFDIRAPE